MNLVQWSSSQIILKITRFIIIISGMKMASHTLSRLEEKCSIAQRIDYGVCQLPLVVGWVLVNLP